MNEKVTEVLKKTNDRLTTTVRFTNRRTTSTERLVDEEEGEALENEDDLNVTPKDSTVEIVITEVDQNVGTTHDGPKFDESRESTTGKKTLTFWRILKWLRKWFGRGIQSFGQGFMYTSPMSATVVLAQELNKRKHIYKASKGSATTHYF